MPFIGIFQLVAEILWVAQIHFGTNTRAAQIADHGHIFGHPVTIHHRHDHRADPAAHAAPLGAQGGQQPVNADGDAGGRHRLAGEALHQIVIAPAARDRAELPLAALFIQDFKGQFRLEHRAGVIAKAADHAGVQNDAIRAIALHIQQFGHGFQLGHALQPDG